MTLRENKPHFLLAHFLDSSFFGRPPRFSLPSRDSPLFGLTDAGIGGDFIHLAVIGCNVMLAVLFCLTLVWITPVQANENVPATFSHRKMQWAPTGTGIDHQYLVVLKTTKASKVMSIVQALLGKTGQDVTSSSGYGLSTPRLEYVFENALKAFVVSGLASSLLFKFLSDDRVSYIAQDMVISKGTDQRNPPSWGIDRIDQHALPLNQRYHHDYQGTGVQAYILDTGILDSHEEFRDDFGNSRVQCGINLVPDETCTDLEGHGSHVAGTVGSRSYGVAKNVALITVKVMDKTGSGSVSRVIAGVDWMTGQKKANTTQAMVANLSIGGTYHQGLNDAIKNAVLNGIVVVVAACNYNTDACSFSPASTPDAITVGAMASSDGRARFSNYGPCVDIFAPGVSIISVGIRNDTASVGMSGTSMAAPHVAGVAALFLERNSSATPDEILRDILDTAVVGKIGNLTSDTPNILVQIPRVITYPTNAPSAAPTRQSGRCPLRDRCNRSSAFNKNNSTSTYLVHRMLLNKCIEQCLDTSRVRLIVFGRQWQCGGCSLAPSPSGR